MPRKLCTDLFFAHQFSLVFVSFMCVPRQLFSSVAQRRPKVRHPWLKPLGEALSSLTRNLKVTLVLCTVSTFLLWPAARSGLFPPARPSSHRQERDLRPPEAPQCPQKTPRDCVAWPRAFALAGDCPECVCPLICAWSISASSFLLLFF